MSQVDQIAMAARAPFLRTCYGAYHHRHIPHEDAELTHIGPDTPCGEYLRRFWQPICYSDDLKDLPLAVNVLGEELVVFRDGTGAVGLLERHCPHRGSSLEFGLVGAKGIRCCYHGWLFDVDGTILETPGEPADSTLKDRLFHGAYPVREAHGIIFCYMGPPDRVPAFPVYDSLKRPGYRIIPGQKYFYPCNWLQILENAMDAAHTAFLHTIVTGAVFTEEFGVLPELEFAETPVGIIYIATRRISDNIWARMVENVLPNLQQIAPAWENGQQPHPFSGPMMSRWIVPVDDTNTMLIELRHISETEGVTPAWFADRNLMLPGQGAADTYEESQRRPQDFEAQVSQRPIAVHGLEHLGATDRGITMFRNQIRRGIRETKSGNDPAGLFRGGDTVIPTYCNDTVVRVPPAETPELDKKLLRETGRRLAQSYLESRPLMAAAE
jgi:nitrite reductase/ring-hydroxylating ferredoxin subunit